MNPQHLDGIINFLRPKTIIIVAGSLKLNRIFKKV